MMKKAIALMMTTAMLMSMTAGIVSADRREDPAAQTAAAGESSKQRLDPYAGDEIKIAYIAHDIGTPNNQGWKEGIERECGSWSNIKVDSYGAEEKAENQVQIMTDCINQGYNAIILQCSHGTCAVRQAG